MPSELLRAEQLERSGDDVRALAAYEDAARRCTTLASRSLRARWCAAALTGRAESLERLGRHDDAATAYEAIGASSDLTPAAAAAGLAEAGKLRLQLGQPARAYELLWRCIITYPDEAAADDALRAIVSDGRRRDAGVLYQGLAQVAVRLAGTEIADNTLAAMADLAEHELHDPGAAIDLYDRLAARYPKSPLRDEALWHAGGLARVSGDPRGALTRWRRLLATRETAFFVGSYNSAWHDDAQLEVGRLLRDELGEPIQALRELVKLAKHYPDSTLIDDSLYEIGLTYERLGDPSRACHAVRELARRFPDSKYLLDGAPGRALAKRVHCKIPHS